MKYENLFLAVIIIILIVLLIVVFVNQDCECISVNNSQKNKENLVKGYQWRKRDLPCCESESSDECINIPPCPECPQCPNCNCPEIPACPEIPPCPDCNCPDPCNGDCPECPEEPKVTICHYPPGNPNNPETIEVSASSLPAHYGHDDTLGPCPSASKKFVTQTAPIAWRD